MTIKGTLETFNLLDLLQMLSFNQKEGSLVLESSTGVRTLFVRRGTFSFAERDPNPSRALARVLRRTAAVAPDRLDRARQIAANANRFLGDALVELGAMDEESCRATSLEAIEELFFDLLQMSISRFEFQEGQCLAPDMQESAPVRHMCAVDAVLLELTRKLDEWTMLRHEVPSEGEVYERTGREPDLRDLDRVPDYLPARVLPLVDGRRSVADVIEESDGDRFSVLKLLSLVLRQGALAPVASGDLEARGEELVHRRMPRQAVPLLRRAVERGDSLPTARRRLAEALEAAGDTETAATEYETYATGVEAEDPAAAFEALHRALRLGRNEVATASRLCDLWLADPERVPHRESEALAALRILVDATGRGGNPEDAAARLSRFLEAGVAPSEDLLVLADLWASAGRPNEAAKALVKRADLLLHEGRTAAARDLLRRALLYDPSRLDVRRRADEMERQHRQKRSRRRSFLVLCVLGLTLGTAGIGWILHDGRAARAAEAALSRADRAWKVADATMVSSEDTWREVVRRAEAGSGTAQDLANGAAALRSAAKSATEALEQELTAAANEIEDRSALGHATTGLDWVKTVRGRVPELSARAEAAVKELADTADRALALGEESFAKGRFSDAKGPLEASVRLSMPGEPRSERARRSLESIARYGQAFRTARGPFDAAVARGDTDEAWREAGRLFERFLDCDMTREIRLPVPVDVSPAGSGVRVGANGPEATSPTVIGYSPFEALDLRLRAPGRVPLVVKLPSFVDLRDAAPRGGLPPTRVRASLVPGPRWASSALSVAAGPFAASDGLWVVVEDGRRIASIRADGSLADVMPAPGKDRIREAGRVGAASWFLAGVRTLHVAPDGGTAWEHTMPGRLTHVPTFVGGTVFLGDDTGLVRALDVLTGAPRWEATLAQAPAQAIEATAAGLLVSLATGEVVALDSARGSPHSVASGAMSRGAFAAPWAEGALLVGGARGLATVDAAGKTRSLGVASPLPSPVYAASTSGCAWLEADGAVVWLGAGEEAKGPVRVTGAGSAARVPALAAGWLYVVGADRVLRGVRLDSPGVTAWSVTLPGDVLSGPVVVGDLLVLRTSTGLVAYDR